jgi:colicin import membrane protein
LGLKRIANKVVGKSKKSIAKKEKEKKEKEKDGEKPKRKSVFGAAKSRVSTLLKLIEEKETEPWGALEGSSGSINFILEEDNDVIQQRKEDTFDDSASSLKSSSKRSSKSENVKSKIESGELLLQLDLDGQTSTHSATTGDLPLKEQPPPESKRSNKTSDQQRNGRRLSARSCSPHGLRSLTRRDRDQNQEKNTEQTRSQSPGAIRGDIARKRQAMNEIRKKRSSPRSILDDDGTSADYPLRSSRRSESTSTTTRELSNFDPMNESSDDVLKKIKGRRDNKKSSKSESQSNSESLHAILGLNGSLVEW